MNKIIAIVCLSFMACSSSKVTEFNFDQLVGAWERSMDEGIMYETWAKEKRDMYSGESVHVLNSDTIWSEEFSVFKSDGLWFYNVLVPDQHQDPVSFKISEMDESSFKAYNETNEFPKIIRYQVLKNGFQAYVTNGETDTIRFNFKKILN